MVEGKCDILIMHSVIMLISPLIDYDWILYNETLIMLYSVQLNECCPDCLNSFLSVCLSQPNPGLVHQALSIEVWQYCERFVSRSSLWVRLQNCHDNWYFLQARMEVLINEGFYFFLHILYLNKIHFTPDIHERNFAIDVYKLILIVASQTGVQCCLSHYSFLDFSI